MNAQTQTQTFHVADRNPGHRPAVSRLPTRDRAGEFGVGYGNSSGYAAPRRYLASPAPQRFRCA
jgi:hypothetical protein